MGTRLFVGNLSFNTSEVDLRDAFTQAGLNTLEVKIVMERETGRPRGFAFVEMADQASATKAIEALNHRELGGRELNVNEARPKEERPPRQFEGGERRGGFGGGHRGDRGDRRGGDRGGFRR